MTYLGPTLRRRRRRAWRGWRGWRLVAGVVLSLVANVVILDLVRSGWAEMHSLGKVVRPVDLTPLSAQRWAANRNITDGSRPPPPARRAAPAPAVLPSPARPAPEPPKVASPTPERPPEAVARQQVVDVAPGNDQVPNAAHRLAESNNSVEKETVSRFAKAGAERTLPRPGQATKPARAPVAPPEKVAQPATPSPGKPGGDGLAPGTPGTPSPQAQPSGAAPGKLAANLDLEGLRRARPAVTPPPDAAAQQPPGQGGEGGEGGRKQTGGQPILEPSPAFYDQLTGNAFPDHVEGADVGDSTFLNTREWKYAGYFNRIKQAVAERWDPRSAIRARDPSGARFFGSDRSTILSVTLTADGALKDVRVARSSGVAFLDQSAVDAFSSAQPFLHPPQGLLDPRGEIHFSFGFHIEAPSGGLPSLLGGRPR